MCAEFQNVMQLDLFTVFRKEDGLHIERRIPMGYHSEPKTPEEIREIFREVQAANVARAESPTRQAGLIGSHIS